MIKEKRADMKKVGTEIVEETYTRLKVLVAWKRTTIADYLEDLIEKHVNSKSKQLDVSAMESEWGNKVVCGKVRLSANSVSILSPSRGKYNGQNYCTQKL